MSSGIIKPPAQSKAAGPGGLTSVTPNSQAILLDKLGRRATPDSEALASSDDEGDQHRQDQQTVPVTQHQKPVRRASWLNDTSQTAIRPRKESFASGTMSPTTSHPSTPLAESGAGGWGSHSVPGGVLGRGHSSASGFSWGAGIWNSDRKEPPSRLSEVLPSPTSTHPPGSSGSFFSASTEGIPTQTSPGPREQGPNSQIPFAIPLHPTPKTYRSQSYSVGQLEPDAAGNAIGTSAMMSAGRGRGLPHSGLQHRPSRPSMLSEMSNEGMLGKVKEVEDDDEESNESLQGSQSQSMESKTIEMLTRENQLLRQQQYHNSRLRPRASTGYGLGNGYSLQAPVPEESDFAIDEVDESNDGSDMAAKRALARRMSEFGASGVPFRSPFAVENRKLETVKKAYWQSSLGFSGVGEQPQSRRHSFADVPQRQASISSLSEHVLGHEGLAQEPQQVQDFSSPYADSPGFPPPNQAPYFPGLVNMGSVQPQVMAPNAYGNPYSYAMHAPFSIANRPASPHRAMYGLTQPNRSTPLHVVLFKCARADVFYIQEGTGLTVKPGDLVIVEADRGTDLGTVAADNVDWVEAKRLKEHYAEEQYRWLMMYSQNASVAQDGVGAGLMAASTGLQGSTVGGMGPPGQHHMQEPNAGELKPKLIKRLAQAHEIHALRDKEGNEAKAKRVCMQKVKEHGLNMEILDAEFQMDWKKLTFYYFADAYINFNSLVTDLFKIYKTRIWMSAINPASFASQPLGLQAPSGIGPGAVGVGRGGASADRRQQAAQSEQQPQPQPQQQPQQANRTFPGQGPAAFAQPFGSERPGVPAMAAYTAATYQFPPYAAFGNPGRAPAGMGYSPAMLSSVDSFPSAFPQAGVDYAAMRARLPTPQSVGLSQHDQGGMPPLPVQHDFLNSFQGLSLNTR